MSLLAVSVDPPETSAALKERLEADFTFVSDQDGALLDALNIRHRGGRQDGADIAYPTTVLVDASGLVRWSYQSDTYRERPRPETIFAAIESLPPGS